MNLGREERLVYLACAELNEKKRQEDMEKAIENAAIRVLNEYLKGR